MSSLQPVTLVWTENGALTDRKDPFLHFGWLLVHILEEVKLMPDTGYVVFDSEQRRLALGDSRTGLYVTVEGKKRLDLENAIDRAKKLEFEKMSRTPFEKFFRVLILAVFAAGIFSICHALSSPTKPDCKKNMQYEITLKDGAALHGQMKDADELGLAIKVVTEDGKAHWISREEIAKATVVIPEECR